MKEYVPDKMYEPKTKVSILIPARNEEKHLGALLDDILSQYYPHHLMEVIVIDDHSTDATAQIASGYKRVRCISLADHANGQVLNAYKKKAIEIGIRESEGELILTTDADCMMCNYWLLSIVQYYESHRPKLIASPVLYTNDGSWFHHFQSIDFTTMQGITAALSATRSGTMCNGANLAYTRQAFEAVHGFEGIDDIASGDDMLLMYKIEQQFPGKTTYLKCRDSIVYTHPMPTVQSFLTQRTRWASKANKFKDNRIRFVLWLVYACNAVFPMLFVAAFFETEAMVAFTFLAVGKTVVELMLLYPVSIFFFKKSELYWFPVLQGLHILYILYAGLKGQSGSYQWKDRTVT
jgi:cellulose synthase/poly-beta-1,6-N-acetylglucosamine synthase-like glycosyltransferase